MRSRNKRAVGIFPNKQLEPPAIRFALKVSLTCCVDSLRNMLANPRIGLLFIIPGVTDTFRVNGRATITVDADLPAPCAVEGKLPILGVLVDIDEAYTQCSKAFLRSRLWDLQLHIDPSTMPTGGEIHRAIQGEQFDAEQYDEERAERYSRRVGFY